jgi:arginine decarboxylase
LDAFAYEPVFVGSFEDAFCATLLNPDLAAVVVHEGFPFRSRHDAPVLRTLAEAANQRESAEASALRLAQVLKRVRPELDLSGGLDSLNRISASISGTSAGIRLPRGGATW